jgi:hypothetical protein
MLSGVHNHPNDTAYASLHARQEQMLIRRPGGPDKGRAGKSIGGNSNCLSLSQSVSFFWFPNLEILAAFGDATSGTRATSLN